MSVKGVSVLSKRQKKNCKKNKRERKYRIKELDPRPPVVVTPMRGTQMWVEAEARPRLGLREGENKETQMREREKIWVYEKLGLKLKQWAGKIF